MDLERIRKDFSILDQVVNDEPLVYLDNRRPLKTAAGTRCAGGLLSEGQCQCPPWRSHPVGTGNGSL